MRISFWIIIGVGTLVGFISLYMMYRSNKVLKFRIEIITLLYGYYKNNKYEDFKELHINNHVASYNKMLWSFKPLKLEYWMTEDMINKIKPC